MIRVLVQPPTKRGRLYPRYDEDAGILVLESREPRALPYGLDIDGVIVFDIDESRVLANLDLHIRADLWERASTAFWPNEVNSGDLAFPDETLKTKSFHLPQRVRTNPNVHYIRPRGTFHLKTVLPKKRTLGDSLSERDRNKYLFGSGVRLAVTAPRTRDLRAVDFEGF